MNRLNFNHFYYFYVVAIEGSIKQAAEVLYVSQPTISDQIKLLEEFFETPLFHRKNRSLILTEKGHVAFEYAQNIFDQSVELTQLLKYNVRKPKTSIDIGMTPFMAHYFKPNQLNNLFKSPELLLNFHENRRELLLVDLENGKLDVLITDSKENLTKKHQVISLGKNRTFAVGHRKLGISVRKFPDSLTSKPFFHYTEDFGLKFEIDMYFSRHSIHPKIVGSSNNTELLNHVVSKSMAFVIVPEVLKVQICQNPNIKVLGEFDELETTVYAVFNRNYDGPALKIIKD